MDKLAEIVKGEIIAQKRVEKSQREILKALGRSKTVICNYLKSLNKHRTGKPIGWPEKIIITISERNCSRSKKENFNIKYIEIFSGCSS